MKSGVRKGEHASTSDAVGTRATSSVVPRFPRNNSYLCKRFLDLLARGLLLGTHHVGRGIARCRRHAGPQRLCRRFLSQRNRQLLKPEVVRLNKAPLLLKLAALHIRWRQHVLLGAFQLCVARGKGNGRWEGRRW